MTGRDTIRPESSASIPAPVPGSIGAVVLGAGPAGLSVAAELQRSGFDVVLLEKADRVGASWAGHYDRLHLHTARALSSLPRMPIPRELGRWVARDDFLGYLHDYSTEHHLDVMLGVTATDVTQTASGEWSIDWSRGDDHGTIVAPLVVVASGYNHTPYLPDWPGIDGFAGRVIHSSAYRNPADLGAKSVLVVGPGNSGGEIAADLAASGTKVLLSMRTPPNIVRRQVAGIPGQALVIAISPLPTAAGDRIARWVQRLTVGDLAAYGIGPAGRGIVTQMARDDVTPTIDVGLLAALRAGTVTVVPAVTGFAGTDVVLSDDSRVSPDVVVAATGYRRGLESLVGHLGVLASSGRPLVNAAEQLAERPGLYFLGYSNPLTGNLRQLNIDARSIARQVTRGQNPP